MIDFKWIATCAMVVLVTTISWLTIAGRIEKIDDKLAELLPRTFQAPAGCVYLEQKPGQLYQLYCNVPLTATLSPMLPAPPTSEKKP